MSKIEWTEATWNPIAGCTVHSPGCTNCYAMRTAARLATIPATAPIYGGLTQPSKAGPVWTGKIAVNQSTMLAPLKRKKPTMYFVNSMSDLFHESVPDEVIDRVFAVMALCPQHTFQVLTKRSARMRAYCISRFGGWGEVALTDAIEALGGFEQDGGGEWGKPLPNVWLGVSVEDQKRADERIPDLLATPAAVRFLSCEPLLGPVDISRFMWPVCKSMPARFGSWVEAEAAGQLTYRRQSLVAASSVFLDWVITGGESGPGARPMHPDWARSLRDQCGRAGVPFFFKQWGDWAPHPKDDLITIKQYYRSIRYIDRDTGQRKSDPTRFSDETMRCIGKKGAGRLLDGVTHDAMPQVQPHG